MPEQMELASVDYYREIEEAVSKSNSRADPDWLREFTTCLLLAAQENETLDVSTVWRKFTERDSRRVTSNKMAAGAVMRLGVGHGWIEQIDRPAGLICKCNHNPRGTAFYRSRVYLGR